MKLFVDFFNGVRRFELLDFAFEFPSLNEDVYLITTVATV